MGTISVGGCLAGPLVVGAAVITKNGGHDNFLQDSKLLTATQREKSFEWITKNCLYATSIISPHDIDRFNIYQATMMGMHKAFLNLITLHDGLTKKLKSVLVDAMPLKLPFPSLPIHHFPKGELYSQSIAAASIVAKVTRDQLMNVMDPIFPAFGLARHKGYGTASHQDALRAHGPSVIHRRTFIQKLHKQQAVQRTLFE